MFNPERSIAIKKEVEKLLSAGSIREVKYPEWVANIVLVKKKNNQWRMCVDFTDLNKACPKDSFPLRASTEVERVFRKSTHSFKTVVGETLYLYLSVKSGDKFGTDSVRGKSTKTSVLHKQGVATVVETRYSLAEKIALALITTARKLRPYFQAHTIEVYTDCPLKLILQKPELLGRLTKWEVELSEFDIRYTPKAAEN
ncbi:hypothetical protein LWI29_005546 [Acer saccharum]|uniref:Reverse transcriptase RNase H-like domain-containing protein n=1 Tax=Acer saccharum TaxID=4024 RepID=A0AA39RCP7_ACESA|nr:hypothetical protein LWI29_005546 [Acer saccharum]